MTLGIAGRLEEGRLLSYDIDQLKEEVEAISVAVEKLRTSGISERALLLLIRDACPTIRVGRFDSKPGMKLIRAVIDGMETLHEFVFPGEHE